MAVTQISQIQVRYGFQEDIGSLAAGEFAWAIDTQRLYIGNGSLEQGAPRTGITEILTDSFRDSDLGPYSYLGQLGGYLVQTGPDIGSPVSRELQDKVDDFVNVRDFSVSSTGVTDQTDNLQRALDQIYDRKNPITGQRTRRALRFNAGIYRIDGELKIPPYATLKGEGRDSVRIILNGPGARLVTTTGGDSSAEITIGQYPSAVNFKGLTIEQSNDDNVIAVDGATDIVFEDVALIGPRNSPATAGSGSCVVLNSTGTDTSNIHFHRCLFAGLGYAAEIKSANEIKNVTFKNCEFKNLYRAIHIDDDRGGTVRGVKITDSVFADIHSTAIYASPGASGVISIGNTFINCASNFQGDIVEGDPWQPIIVFQSDGNYSFMDIFARSPDLSRLYPRVSSESYRCGYLSLDQYFGLGTAQYYSGVRVSISDGSNFTIPTISIRHGIINYSLKRNNMTRSGSINFSSQGNSVVWSEDYTESSDLGVQLNLLLNATSGKLEITGSTTGTGQPTAFSFDFKHLA